jgi:adenosine 3'-phospho 5'-phosphosulfate transporter B2
MRSSSSNVDINTDALNALFNFFYMSILLFSLAYLGHLTMRRYATARNLEISATITTTSGGTAVAGTSMVIKFLDFLFVGKIAGDQQMVSMVGGGSSLDMPLPNPPVILKPRLPSLERNKLSLQIGTASSPQVLNNNNNNSSSTTTTTTSAVIPISPSGESEQHHIQRAKLLSLIICTIGLQVSYLMWGVMQEQLMTSTYGGESFPSSSILVLSNRWVAIIFALVAVSITQQPPHRAPAVEYSFASVSNVLSSYCQYEALRFVSFPVQTVCKASKVIPVMIMGTIIHRKPYSTRDYLSAFIITFGVASFGLIQSGYTYGHMISLLVSGANGDDIDKSESFSPLGISNHMTTSSITGGILLISYLALDSFTSNWQAHLFQEHKLSTFQVMLGINIFSTFFSIVSLIQNGELFPGMEFLLHHPDALTHTLLMSFCGAVGQLFIYKTIAEHGAIVFNIISVTRQLLSIVISAIIFGHSITFQAWIAVFITFGGIIYRNMGSSTNNKKEKM